MTSPGVPAKRDEKAVALSGGIGGVLDELRAQGRIQTTGMETDRLTFHDPCSIVRRGGIMAQPRNLLEPITENFVEMNDHGSMNWCCGGGDIASLMEEQHPLIDNLLRCPQ